MINLTISVFIPQHNKDTISRHWNHEMFLKQRFFALGKKNVGHFSRETAKGNHMCAHEQAWLAFSFEVGLSSRKVGEYQLNKVVLAQYMFSFIIWRGSCCVGWFVFSHVYKYKQLVCTILLLTSAIGVLLQLKLLKKNILMCFHL